MERIFFTVFLCVAVATLASVGVDSASQSQMITVCVELMFDANNHTVGKTQPSPACLTVQNGTNTHDILKLAATQDSCYNFTAVNSSIGHYITSICGIQQQIDENFYWSIYIAPDEFAPVGIDDLKPKNGTTVIFKFEKVNTHGEFSTVASKGHTYGGLKGTYTFISLFLHLRLSCFFLAT